MNQDWEKWGKNIQDIVQGAVESGNFDRLNQTVSSTVNEAVDGIRQGVIKGAETVRERTASMWQESRPGSTSVRRKEELFQKKTGQKALGVLMTVAGGILAVPSVLMGIAVLLVWALSGGLNLVLQIAAGFALPLALAGIVLIRSGTGISGMVKRFTRYIEILNGRYYCNISELAQYSGLSARKVRRDLRKMIAKGWFREGHLDSQETCLMVTSEAWQEYLALQRQREEMKQAEQEQRLRAGAEEEKQKNMTEAEKVIQKGREYLAQIRACNDAIPGEEISRKISRIEELTERIFRRVEEEPSTVGDIRRLMEYYLPTTVKLLEAYESLEGQPVEGENIRQSKQEIEKTLDTLNGAFEKLLDSLFQDVSWDVSSDISVLEAMLAQEGLTEEDFKKRG